jgi:Transglycosylase-like domain
VPPTRVDALTASIGRKECPLRVPDLTGRLGLAATTSLAIVIVVTVAPVDVDAGRVPKGLTRFKAAVGSVESGGRYTARNPVTGAYGKYQILPSNWPAWARSYVGSSRAKPTPGNQERVASGKMTSLYRWLGSWRRVAYWWLTGSSRTTGWSAASRRYVERVMAKYHGNRSRSANVRLIGDRSASIDYGGRWRIARHPGYRGATVRYATARGASATLTFTGRGIAWHGPTGPTRGQAKVYIDGKLVKTVDLRSSSFHARSTVFSRRWSSARKHTIRIVVVGTSGRAMVAIDGFAVTK